MTIKKKDLSIFKFGVGNKQDEYMVFIDTTTKKAAKKIMDSVLKNQETVKVFSAELPKIRKLQKEINKQALDDQLILRAIEARLELYRKRDYGNPGAEDRFVSRVQTILQSGDGIFGREVF